MWWFGRLGERGTLISLAMKKNEITRRGGSQDDFYFFLQVVNKEQLSSHLSVGATKLSAGNDACVGLSG